MLLFKLGRLINPRGGVSSSHSHRCSSSFYLNRFVLGVLHCFECGVRLLIAKRGHSVVSAASCGTSNLIGHCRLFEGAVGPILADSIFELELRLALLLQAFILDRALRVNKALKKFDV